LSPLDIAVVLVSPRNPLNIGAAARAMSNFGFADMRLVNPYDLAFQEAKSAVKAHYILAQAKVFSTVAEAVADCNLVIGGTSVGNRDLHLPLHRLEAGGQLLKQHSGHAAILFGSEKFGLSNDDMSHCQWLYSIPARPEHASMNLGQAVAITLYELRRDPAEETVRFPPSERAAGAELERFTELLLKMLNESGYIPERTGVSSEQKLRRLVMRLGMPASDADTWLGMLRQIHWKMKSH